MSHQSAPCQAYRQRGPFRVCSREETGHGTEAMLTAMHGVQFFFAVAGGGNGRSLVLVLTELTGMYCISSVLLIRKQLPIQYRCCL